MDKDKKRQIIVGIETALDGGSLSLIENRSEIDFMKGDQECTRSEDILIMFEKLLKKNKIGRNEIEKVCVSKGPGSITGTRIGLATALGIGNSLQREVFEISILDAMYLNNLSEGAVLTALFDGRSGIFSKIYLEKTGFDRPQNKETFYKGFGEFFESISEFVKAPGSSYVLTDKLVQMANLDLSSQNQFSKLSNVTVCGKIAKSIALASYENKRV